MMVMNSSALTKDNVIYFFNKYKFNSNRISILQRQLLSESNATKKWQSFIAQMSDLTRALYTKNEALLNSYLRPIIEDPTGLKSDVVWEVLLHITFYLFENHTDSLVTLEVINSLLAHKELLNNQSHFEALFNLGIYNSLVYEGTFQTTFDIFNEAMTLYPDFQKIRNQDIRIHIIFCRIYQMLDFCLYNHYDAELFITVYNALETLLSLGDETLYIKMWGDDCDSSFHTVYLMRFARIYGIFMSGRANFSANSASQELIARWLIDEYTMELPEGEVNLMIFTYYHKLMYQKGKITQKEYISAMTQKLQEQVALYSSEQRYIFPECAFPVDDPPIEKCFSTMLDRMKLFNKTFSYLYVFLLEASKIVQDPTTKNTIVNEVIRYFQASKYGELGFRSDRFEVELISQVAKIITGVDTFLDLSQNVFIHRQISTANHILMVKNISALFFNTFVEKRPELFVTNKYPTVADVLNNKTQLCEFIKNGGVLHDIGKLTQTALINLHFRRITDKEFYKIRAHTNYGGIFVKDIPYLAPYYDFCVGHHKYWNDSGGYPASFHLKDSQYKYYVAIVTLADCIDSSTDTQGRNYANKKELSSVFNELELSKGSRYSEELVDLLLGDEDLKNKLKQMLQEGRKQNLEESYKKFIAHKVSFNESKVSVIDTLNEELAKGLPDFYKKCYAIARTPKIKAHVDALLKAGSNTLTLVMHNKSGEIYALASGTTIFPIKGDAYFNIEEFLVAPAMRRGGLGTRLLSRITETVSEQEIKTLRITLTENTQDEAFFWIGGFAKLDTYQLECNSW